MAPVKAYLDVDGGICRAPWLSNLRVFLRAFAYGFSCHEVGAQSSKVQFALGQSPCQGDRVHGPPI
jgi:hypothetical protein